MGSAMHFVAWDGFVRLVVGGDSGGGAALTVGKVAGAGSAGFQGDFGGESHVAGVVICSLQ